MQLSNAGEYGVKAMLHLAFMENRNCKIVEISQAWGISDSFLRKILIRLSKAGLVTSSRGVSGGYILARFADNITMLDIVEAIEGKIYLNKCLLELELCENVSWCPIHRVWEKAQTAFTDSLNSTTLKDLVSEPEFRERLKNILNNKK
jgi:Rrf2 family protein